MAGYKYWIDTEILTHTDVNGYLMAQTVPRFLTEEERTDILPAPVTGQLSHVVDLGVQIYLGSTWVDLVTSQLGTLALTTVSVVANQAEQLALTAEQGDVAVRTDQGRSYIRNAGVAGTMADWTELLTPTDTVLSVNTQTGIVVLTKADVSLPNVDNTTDAGKPVSVAQQAALDLKAALASPTFTGTPTLPTGTVATTQAPGNNATAIATTAFVEAVRVALAAADALALLKSGGTMTGNLAINHATVPKLALQAAGAERAYLQTNAGGDTLLDSDGYVRLASNNTAALTLSTTGVATFAAAINVVDQVSIARATVLPALLLKLTADPGSRFLAYANGDMYWGNGTDAHDVSLLRASSALLATGGGFRASGDLTVKYTQATQVLIGDQGPAGQAGIRFGSAADTNLYRAAAGRLHTDGIFTNTGNVYVAYSQPGQILLGDRGPGNEAGIQFGSASDTNLYRSAADTLRTDDALIVGGALRVNGNVGFYNTAPAAKPTVTGSRTDGTALASLLTGLASLGLIVDSSTA